MKKSILSIFLLGSFYSFAQETPKKDTSNVKEIQEVLISKKVFKKESDRFVYDISNAPVAKGNTAFEILKQTPLLSSTDDQNLKIAGKSNAVVYINGRKSNMDAESLAQFLKNTPAENIQKIEVITMPGSEFQVESSDGIINIVLKKKATDGWNGNFRMSNTQSKYNGSSSSGSINYRKGKFGMNANLSGGQNVQAQRYIFGNGNHNSSSYSVGTVESPRQYIGGYINVDYQINDNSNIALSWNNWNSKSPESTINLFNTVKYLNPETNLWDTNYNITQSSDNGKRRNSNFNLNYELKTDSLGSKLNINAAYLNYKGNTVTDNYTVQSDINQTKGRISNYIYQKTPQEIDNISILADYIQKFKNNLSVSVGGNFNKTETDNDTQYKAYTYLLDGSTIEDNKPNHFIYDEEIYGMYITVDKKFSDKFSGKIGTRYEITNTLGTSDNAQDEKLRRIERNYTNLLPYISLNYAINETHNISYAFSSRMRRPSFWELNPVRNILTQNNYTQNDPFVKASSVYNQELTYMYKSSYFLILNHSLHQDVITQVPLQGIPVHPDGTSGTQNQMRYIRTNFGDKQEYNATFGIQKNFFKKYWTTNFNIGAQHNINKGSLSVDPTSGDKFPAYINDRTSTSLMIQTNNTIQLDKAKTWFAGVNYFFIDKQQIELGELDAIMSLDLSIKKLWNNWTFSANFNDILNTNKVKVNDVQANGNYNYVSNNMYNRSVTVSAVYNFGNQKVQKIRNIKNASDDIKNRTGN